MGIDLGLRLKQRLFFLFLCFWVLNEKIVFWVLTWELGDGIERREVFFFSGNLPGFFFFFSGFLEFYGSKREKLDVERREVRGKKYKIMICTATIVHNPLMWVVFFFFSKSVK